MSRLACIKLIVGLLMLVTVIGCRPNISLSEESYKGMGKTNVAEADGGYALSAEDFYSRLSKSTLLMNGGIIDAKESRHLLDSIVLDTLAGLAASEVRLDKYYIYFTDFLHQYYDYLIYRYWQETLYKHVTADSLEAVEFYHEHPDMFAVEEQVNLYHILVSPYSLQNGPDSAYYRSFSIEEMRQEIAEYADKLWRLLNYGEAFENVAYMFSHDATSREQGGYMGWTVRGKYIDPFDSVAFSLQPGEYSHPYLDKDGWHILYIDGYLPSGPAPIDSPQVYQSAYETVLTHKSNLILEARLDSLDKEINIVPNERILNADINLLADPLWAGILNGRDTIDCRVLKRFEEATRHKYDVDNTTPEMKLEMLHKAANRYIQVQAARAVGIDTLPDVIAREEQLRHAKSKVIVQRDAHDFTWKPKDSIVDAYYYDHIDEYVAKKPYRVEQVTVNDSTFAEFLREQVLTGVDMADLRSEFANQGGFKIRYVNLGYIGPDDIPERYYRMVERTRPGSVSGLVRTGSGDWRFFKVLDQKPSRPIELVRGEIRMKMKKEHAREVWRNYRDKMYARFNVRFPVRISEIHLGNYHVRNQ